MRVGIIGATSFVGQCLLPLVSARDYDVTAFSRQPQCEKSHNKIRSIKWHHVRKSDYSPTGMCPATNQISNWICLAPIWVFSNFFAMLSFYGSKHVVALSSTSRFTKNISSDSVERALAQRLITGEEEFIAWATEQGITWTILRPTMTYGFGKDKNISTIINFIRRFSFFLLLGKGKGLRQPIHVSDVATSCLAALNEKKTVNNSYNLSGGEILSYREMVCRIFSILDKTPYFIKLSPLFFRIVLSCLRLLPRFRHWTFAMVERMNQNLVFDHKDAHSDFNFSPRPFIINQEDIPA